jgi:hypothetical protein
MNNNKHERAVVWFWIILALMATLPVVIALILSVTMGYAAEPNDLELVVVNNGKVVNFEGEIPPKIPPTPPPPVDSIDVWGQFTFQGGVQEHDFVVALCDVVRLPDQDVCIYDTAFSPSSWIHEGGYFQIYDAPVKEYAVVHVLLESGWPYPVFALDPGTGQPIRFYSTEDLDLGTISYPETFRQAWCSVFWCEPTAVQPTWFHIYINLAMKGVQFGD